MSHSAQACRSGYFVNKKTPHVFAYGSTCFVCQRIGRFKHPSLKCVKTKVRLACPRFAIEDVLPCGATKYMLFYLVEVRKDSEFV